MILVLSREDSAEDQRQAEGLVQLYREMEVGYSRLVTISTTTCLRRMTTAAALALIGLFIRCGTQGSKGPRHRRYTDPEHDPMIPYVIVLEPGLVVFKIYNGYWFLADDPRRASQDLRAWLRKCRSDWDITRPELKSAWEAG